MLSDAIGHLGDIQCVLEKLRGVLAPNGRIVLTYYNFLWEPALKVAERFGYKRPWPEQNWLSMNDIANLLFLSGFEVVRKGTDILLPAYVPVVSEVANRVAWKLPLVKDLALVDHFEWQTRALFVSERESDLVRRAFLPLGKRVLDVGCGEGATLFHLGTPEGAVGVDLFEEKLAFARGKLPGCHFVATSAEAMPFSAESFDHVLVRDVVHHLNEPERLIDECRRVLAPGGHIDVLEPCRYNPLILLHALTKPAERGELRSTMPFLIRLLSRRFTVVANAAARVGGILANDTYRGDFIRDNLLIEANVIDAAYSSGVKKLLFLGSSCIYPKHAPQPIKEEHLLTGPLEPTNQPYAIAKIAGLEMIDAYRRQHGFCGMSVMPTNLYGPHDNFDPRTSHVLPGLIRRFHEAKHAGAPEVVIWGTGTPRREFLHVDDLASACLLLMREYDGAGILNVGVGQDITIRELAELVKEVVGFRGELRFDPSKPDGTPRKLLDVSRLNALGWRAKIPLRRGIEETYAWFLER